VAEFSVYSHAIPDSRHGKLLDSDYNYTMNPTHLANLSFTETRHSNASAYTLDTVHDGGDDDLAPLLIPETPSYGATFPHSPTRPSSRKVIFNATLKMACIFGVSTLFLGGTLWLALPTLEE
jgi:hypothetical protein